jgi:pimeloyl-ACP methyl ester carboxylesterase
MPKPSTQPRRSHTHKADPEIVDPRWLLKAGAVVVAFAVLCVLALFWTTFYLTQWQYVLAPSRTVATTPAAVGLTFTEVQFGVDITGQPQLTGWWIPADTPTSPTVLLLHDGKGSMSDAIPQAHILHDANLNVLLFDYRGFGHSGSTHPTQAMMQEDAESALNYLRDKHNLHPGGVLVYGVGLGASLAVKLCSQHALITAVILDSPLGDTQSQLLHETRTKLIPVRLLFHEQFPLAAPLQTLTTPKLIISYPATPTSLDRNRIADPKMTVTLLTPNDTTELHNSLRRFLDTYVSNP